MDQLGPGHVALPGRGIKLLQFFSRIPGGNGKFFHGGATVSLTTTVVKHGSSLFPKWPQPLHQLAAVAERAKPLDEKRRQAQAGAASRAGEGGHGIAVLEFDPPDAERDGGDNPEDPVDDGIDRGDALPEPGGRGAAVVGLVPVDGLGQQRAVGMGDQEEGNHGEGHDAVAMGGIGLLREIVWFHGIERTVQDSVKN